MSPEQTFAAFCRNGHRLVPSTGACWTVREVVPPNPDPNEAAHFFEYVYLDCEREP